MFQIEFGGAVIRPISLPGIVATLFYLGVALIVLREKGVRLSPTRLAMWTVIILPSIWTVQIERTAEGLKLGPLTCAPVAIGVSFFAIAVQSIAGQFPHLHENVDPVLTKFHWAEMLLIVVLANTLGDVYGAYNLFSPDSPGVIGGAGWIDGLVWVPAAVTVLYALARRYVRPEKTAPSK